MIWLIIALVIGCIVGTISAWGAWDKTGAFWGAFGCSLIFTVPGLLIMNAIMYDSVPKNYTESSIYLENLGDGMSTSGSFFLGSGTIDSEPVYMYYVNNNGRYTLQHIPADDVVITYTDGPPRLYERDSSSKDLWLSLWAGTDTKEFQVPRGSIKQNFVLDAQ